MEQPIFHPTTEWNNDDKVARMLKDVARNILIFAFGLFPLLFLPIPYLSFGYTKIIVLVVAVVVSVILYCLAALREGKIEFQLQWGVLAIWGVAAITFVSAVFSGDFNDAVLSDGMSSQSAILIALLALIVTVTGLFTGSKTAVMRLFSLMALSALFLGIFHFLRAAVGAEALSLNIVPHATASPIGDWNSLAIFFGLVILLSLVALEQLTLTKYAKYGLVALSVVSLLVLILVNFKMVWWALLIVSFMVILYSLVRHRFVDPQLRMVNDNSTDTIYTIIIALAVFLVAGAYVVAGPILGRFVAGITEITYIEIRPSTSATVDIATQVLKADPLLGVGPNRFIDAWRMHKNPAINGTIFWNSNFDVGSSYFLTTLIQTGLLGALAWLIFFGTLVYSGFRLLMRTLRVDSVWYFASIAALVAAVYLWGLSFFYVLHPVILILAAIVTGLFLTGYGVLVPGRTYSISIERHRNFGFVLIAIVVVILGSTVGGMYVVGKQFIANYQFNRALSTIQPGDTLSNLEMSIAEAYSMSRNDVFARQVATYQLFQINTLLQISEPSEVQKTAFNDAVRKGISSANLATTLDGTDPLNWQLVGQIHSALLFAGVAEAYDVAKSAFEKATSFDPKNPTLPLLQAELEVRKGNATEARRLAEAALALRPNYTEAVFLLAQLDIVEGKVDEAIAKTQNIIQLEPQNPARWYQLGVLYATDANIDQAIVALEEAVRLNPEYANARYLLGLGYYEKGRKEDSLEQLQVVAELNPNNAAVANVINRINNNEPLIQNIGATNPVSEGTDAAATENISDEDVDSDLVTSVNNIPAEETTATETTEAAETPDSAN